ncbi:MAG: prolipoprotein diacylglyceryl transferase [Cyclobacteriaceae bacterium]|nr:prolipoprotein diacylglyceryl transferase [Cyclobacteriaceae bacterium]
MHPKFFSFNVPEFLQGYLPKSLTIHFYGFLIAIGAILAFIYMAKEAKKQYGLKFDDANTLFILLLIASIVGGKIFFFFESPDYYLSNPKQLFSGGGFVFYGSLIFTIPTMYLFFKSHNLPWGGMLDIMAISTCIVHALGRMGCFMAGCCHGLPYEGSFSVTFTDSASLAQPLNTPLHPTQLYSVTLIVLILIMLLRIKKRKLFDGQMFISYLILYASGRVVIEIFRGDLKRGFIIGDYVSHSQFISFIIICITVYIYYRLYMKSAKKV